MKKVKMLVISQYFYIFYKKIVEIDGQELYNRAIMKEEGLYYDA